MDLLIYGMDLNAIGVVDVFQSLRWRRKYFETGEFELHAPATESNLSLLKIDNVIVRNDRKEAGIINSIKISTENGCDMIAAFGRFGSILLNEVEFIDSFDIYDKSSAVCMCDLVSCYPPDIENYFSVEPPTITDATSVSCDPFKRSELSIIEAISRHSNIGFGIFPNFDSKKWIFRVYKGSDKSVSSGNNFVVFSENYNNIFSTEFTRDKSNFKNYASVWFGDADINRVTVDRSGTERKRMLFVDGTVIKDYNGETAEHYQKRLIQYGSDKLNEYNEPDNFEAKISDGNEFKYLTDWDLGDIVTFEKWGISLNERVTEVEEVYENGVLTVSPTVGSPLPEKIFTIKEE